VEFSGVRCPCGDGGAPRLLYLDVTTGFHGLMHARCSICGREADPATDGDPPVTWCADTVETRDGPHLRWVCTACTRKHIRSIESELERQFW
jgi:hypothetical protein